MNKKTLFLLLVFCLSFFGQISWAAGNMPKSGRVIYFEPYSSSKTGPFHDAVSRQSLQVYAPATGQLTKEYRQEAEDYWGIRLDSCLMLDRDLNIGRNSQFTIALCFSSNNKAVTRGPLALMRKGQPDSLWYFPVSIEKNRMIYMEGRPAPDSAVVRSRWHYLIEGGMMSTVFIQIDMKTGRHEIYMRDSAAVFYNDRLAQLAELPNRIVFTPQEDAVIHEFAVYNRLLSMKEMQQYYDHGNSKEYIAKHQMKAPVPIVNNIGEASGIGMHGWDKTRWGWTIAMLALIVIWTIGRFRNIRVHYSFSGSPLIILAGLFGTWYLQTVKDFDVEYLWIYNTIQILAYYLVSFRADPMYTIRNAGGVGSVVNYVGGILSMVGEILDSIPHTIWEVTYKNTETGEKKKQTETHYNIVVTIFWFIVFVTVIWLFIILAEVIYQLLPVVTLGKFIVNFFKERKAFREANQVLSDQSN